MTEPTYQVTLTGFEISAVHAVIQAGLSPFIEAAAESILIADIVDAAQSAQAKLKEVTK